MSPHPPTLPNTKTHLRKTSSKDDDLIELAHLLEEIIDAGALEDVEVVPVGLDLDGDDVVRGRHSLFRP